MNCTELLLWRMSLELKVQSSVLMGRRAHLNIKRVPQAIITKMTDADADLQKSKSAIVLVGMVLEGHHGKVQAAETHCYVVAQPL